MLYRCSSPAHLVTYTSLARLHPTVRFIDETLPPTPPSPSPSYSSTSSPSPLCRPLAPFSAHLRSLLLSTPCAHTLFCVDDLLFFSSFSLPTAIRTLSAHAHVLGYHLTLHARLRYHQPSSSPLTLPPFTPSPSPSPSSPSSSPSPSFSSLLFPYFGGGSHDFRYPFSLTASLYRTADLTLLLSSLALTTSPAPTSFSLTSPPSSSPPPAPRWHHPNLLEVAGNVMMVRGLSAEEEEEMVGEGGWRVGERVWGACPEGCGVCVVVTVNRVQEVYRNRVEGGEGRSVEELRERWEEGGWELDEQAYAARAQEEGGFDRVHVGHWWLRRGEREEGAEK